MQVICLANSYKHQARCIAGVAVDSGNWVRPISNLSDGRIPIDDRRIPAEQINILDIIDIPLSKDRGSGHESENILYTSESWQLVGRAEIIQILPYCDRELLYPEFGRKVPFSYLKSIQPVRTLQLIEVKQIRWERNQYGKCKAFILDEIYDCLEIGFSITDPLMITKINQGETLSHHCLLCMSLGQPWQGANDSEPMCYRLVAGVLELLPEITLIRQEMQRVGWTIPQGRHYLQTEFSKQSRYQLTASEAQILVEFLQSLPTSE